MMNNATLPFTLIQRLLSREANRADRKLPDLSLALSSLDYLMRWNVMDKNNNLVAIVDGESVVWADESKED